MTNPLVQEVQQRDALRPDKVGSNSHEVAVHRRYNAFMLNIRGLSRFHANVFNPKYNHHSWIAKEHFVPDFVKYFGMEIPKGDTLSITTNPFNMNKSSEKCYHLGLNITYTTPGFYANIANFPVEICDKIFAFSCYAIELQFQITFMNTYPFEAPFWTLVEVKNTIPKANLPYPTYKLSDYYQHVVSMHNKLYQNPKNWSPAIDIEKDVLDFIRKINHFPEMFNAIQ